MSFQFDHFIHFVNSPKKAIEKFDSLGLHAVEGGRHESHGTYNSLCYFGLSYIELLGIFNQKLVEAASEQDHSLRATLVKNKFKEGTTRIALRTEQIKDDAERFKKLGLEVVGPVDFSRTRPDGSLVTWNLLFVGKQGDYPELPFFIQWDESDEERLTDLTKRGTIQTHPIGEVELSAVGIAVKDIESVTKLWSHYLQLDIGQSFFDESLQAKAQVLHLREGNIIFYEPIGNGKVKDILNTDGEKPFIIELKSNIEKDIHLFNVIYRFKK